MQVQRASEVEKFFVEVLGWKVVGRKESYPAIFMSDGLITLTFWRAVNPDKVVTFDRKNNIGLHHLALNVKDLDSLEYLHSQVNQYAKVMSEFSPEPTSKKSSRSHFICTIAGGLRIEFATK